jgi:uncharacterized membrane protein YcaP (DUF421 family)
VEVLTQGDVTLLVKNGIIDVGQLKNTDISHEQLFEQLRGNKVRQLGQVKRVYLEASGQFSIFRYAKDKPGLCILPAEDEKVYRSERRTDRFFACKNCGNVKEKHTNSPQPCSLCGANDWDLAVAVPREEPAEKSGAAQPNPQPEITLVPAASGA